MSLLFFVILKCYCFNYSLNEFNSSIRLENYAKIENLGVRLHQFDNVPWEASDVLFRKHFSGEVFLSDQLLDSVLINLGSNGVPKEYILQSISSFKLMGNERYLKKWKEGNERFLKSFSIELRAGIDSLLTIDQDYRRETSKDELRVRDSLTFISFKYLCETYGYPNSKKIGVYFFTSSDGKVVLNNSANWILYWHYAQRQKRDYLELITKAMFRREISAYDFSLLETHYHLGENYSMQPLYRIRGQYYRENYSIEYLKKIDSLRNTRGLMSIQEQIDETIYQGKME